MSAADELLDLFHQNATNYSRPTMKLLLQRLEGSPALIHATRAIVIMSQSQLRSEPIAVGRQLATREYTHAISAINANLLVSPTEPVLFAIGLAYSFEFFSFNVPFIKHHARGMHALLRGNAQKWSQSEVGRTLVFSTRPAAIEGSIAVGKPSPFEHDIWFEYQTPPGSDAAVLNKLAHKLLFKLPRLVSYIRVLRSGQLDAVTVSDTIDWAQRMLRIRNDAAYRSVLLSCEKRSTESEIDLAFAPLSFHFSDLGVFDDFLDYCRARLAITTLYLSLQRWAGLAPQKNDTCRLEQLDLVDNVLACLELCMQTNRWSKCMNPALFPLYGALRQMDAYRGVQIEDVMAWLEMKSMIAFSHVPDFKGRRDLAATWEVYCGGPIGRSIYRHWAD